MSIYKTVEESLVRDYEVVRTLTDETMGEITLRVMEELNKYKTYQCTDQFIHQIIGETLTRLIAKGVEHERNINKSV
jgi:hypothetical protein